LNGKTANFLFWLGTIMANTFLHPTYIRSLLILNLHHRKWDAHHTCLMITTYLNVQSLFIITSTSARDSGTQVVHSSCHC
jgi:hypothetical protein